MKIFQGFNAFIASIFLAANFSFFGIANAVECEVIDDLNELDQIRENAQVFGNYSEGWILIEDGITQCLPFQDTNDFLCTVDGSTTLLTMSKQREYVSGIRVVGSDFSEFFVRSDGNFECSDTLINVDALKKALAPKQDD